MPSFALILVEVYLPRRGRSETWRAGKKVRKSNLTSLLKNRTAGDPDKEDIVFTELPAIEIAERVTDQGTPVSDKTVVDWFKELGLRLRKMPKDISGGSSPDREVQFDRIGELIDQYTNAGNPCFSVDTKAKEHLGRLYRAGRVRTSDPFHAFDHDFPSWADGKVVPHGIYDLGSSGILVANFSGQWYRCGLQFRLDRGAAPPPSQALNGGAKG